MLKLRGRTKREAGDSGQYAHEDLLREARVHPEGTMKIVLESGRKVVFERLEQWATYGGLLAGRPDARLNRAHITDLEKAAARYSPEGGEPHIIMPTEDAIASSLPAVTCLAVLTSGPLERSDSDPYSSLAIGWFQGKFAFPLDEKIEAAIRAIDWEAKAKDWLS